MPCPACGGQDRDLVAPGYWRCTSAIQDTIIGPGPGAGRGPGIEAGPQSAPYSRQRVCGREYQEAGPEHVAVPECACGTFAIGRCAECSRPVCGDHSRLCDQQRLCCEHADARDLALQAEREETQRRDKQSAADRLNEQQASWMADSRRRLDELDHDVPRLLVLIASLTPPLTTPRFACYFVGGRLWQLIRSTMTDAPDTEIRDIYLHEPWNSRAVADWWITQAGVEPCEHPIYVKRKQRLLGTSAQKTFVPGWTFSAAGGVGPAPDFLILQTGEVTTVSPEPDSTTSLNARPGPRDCIDEAALQQFSFGPHVIVAMHEQAGLPLLEPYPAGDGPPPSARWDNPQIVAQWPKLRALLTGENS